MTALTITRDNPLLEYIAMSHWAISTTKRCQQRCVYCSIPSPDRKDNLDLEEMRELLTEAAEAVPAVVFMGAEPTLNPHLLEAISLGTGLGLKMTISTNGLRFADPKFLTECVEAGLVAAEMSFPYPNAEVYHRITRAPARNFAKLLAAMDNIEALNADVAKSGRDRPGLPVNINVVVSRANIGELDQLLDHVAEHFNKTPLIVTFKWIEPGGLPDPDYLADFHVRLSSLRQRFGPLLDRWRWPFPAIFRNFPLCAIPGHEQLSANIVYYAQQADVKCNFNDQTDFYDMHPVGSTAAPYAGFCGNCSVQNLCFERRIFDVEPPHLANRPVPSVLPIDSVLEALPFDARSTAASPGVQRSAAPEGDRYAIALYHELTSKQAGIEARSDFHFTLADVEEPVAFYAGPYRPEYDSFYAIPGGILAELETPDLLPDARLGPIALGLLESPTFGALVDELLAQGSGEETLTHGPLLQAVSRSLRRPSGGAGSRDRPAETLPLCRRVDVEPGGQGVEATLSFDAGTAELEFASATARTEAPGRWTLVSGSTQAELSAASAASYLAELEALLPNPEHPLANIARAVCQDLADTGSAAGGSPSVLGYWSNGLVVTDRDRMLTSCRLLTPAQLADAVPGFLCGGLVLVAAPPLFQSSHSTLLTALAESLSRQPLPVPAGVPAEGGWHGRLWQLVGPLLLPRSGQRSRVIGGVVAPDRVALELAQGLATASITFEKTTGARGDHEAPGDDTVLRFDGPRDNPVFRRVFAGYAQHLRRALQRRRLPID